MTSESGVPELPSGIFPRDFPLSYRYGEIHTNTGTSNLNDGYNKWFVEVLNAVYTPGTGLRDRLAAAEEELQRLKTAK